MLTVTNSYKTAITSKLTQPGFLVKVGWTTPKYFSSRGTVTYQIPGDLLSSTFVSTPINVTAVNSNVAVKSTGNLTIGIDPINPLLVTQYALSDSYGFGNTPIDIWLFDGYNIYKLAWWATTQLGYYISTPDSVLNSIVNDIDIRADMLAAEWIPSATQTIVSKRLGASAISYRLSFTTTGYLLLEVSVTGTAVISYTSTSLHNFVNNTRYWLRATRNARTGQVYFYTSTDGLNWTQLGTVVTGTVGAIFDSTTALEIGSYVGGTLDRLYGNIYRIQIYEGIQGTPYLLLDGASGGYISSPDSILSRSSGDTDIRVKIALDSYIPATVQDLISKNDTDSSLFSYLLRLDTNGYLVFYWTTDGTALKSAASTVIVNTTTGSSIWVRSVIVVNNGAAGQDVYFYTSTDYDADRLTGTWTQLGTIVTVATAGNIFVGIAPVRIGARGAGGGGGMCTGKIYRAQLFKGINGNLCVDFNPSALTVKTSPFTSPTTGEAWTFNGSAKLGGVINVDYYPVDDTGSSTTFSSVRTGETWTYSNGASITVRSAATTEIAAADAIKIFKGIGDSVTLTALELQTTLIPLNLVSSLAPRVKINPRNGFNYIQPKGTIVPWGTERFTLE